MTEDRNREEPQFSRSGRVLKKTLKMKEMEDFEIKDKDDRQEKARRHLIHPSKNHKLGGKQTQYLVHEGRGPNSIGSLNLSPSSDISCVELYSTPKRGCQVSSSSQKTFELYRLNDAYSSDGDRTWSTSEDASSTSESGEKSGECLKVHSKQLRIKKNLKTNYAKFLKLPNLKHRARRKTTATAKKMLCTKIKTFEPGIAVSSCCSARKMEIIEDINKILPFTEMCKKLGGAHTMPNGKREVGDIEQDYLQHFENFSKEISYKSPKSSDTVTNQLTLQEHQQSPEQLESKPVLGTSPIDVAAHLVLLGNGLSNIGMAVANLDYIGPGVYSCLLDILLCSMGPLLCLTRNIVGLERVPEDVFLKILDHVAYIIPSM